jgi:hypothetical protein
LQAGLPVIINRRCYRSALRPGVRFFCSKFSNRIAAPGQSRVLKTIKSLSGVLINGQNLERQENIIRLRDSDPELLKKK